MGLLGWVVQDKLFGDVPHAVLFAVVAAMMKIISTRVLLPTAHQILS